jgi:CRISPR-associated endoribonuclease Cas6
VKNISITFNAPGLSIPLNYHHEVQSLLYRLLRENKGANWHNSGAAYGSRQYKLFTFSSLRGIKKIAEGRLNFERQVYLDVRCVREDFCNALIEALEQKPPLILFGQPLAIEAVKTSGLLIVGDDLSIKMLSPLTIHQTDEAGATYYFTPLDVDFAEKISGNFRRKYTAFSGEAPLEGIKIIPNRVSAGDKYVTTYKGIHITAWRGEYQLLGRAEYLNFLYYCGLGARNSEGFGMFAIRGQKPEDRGQKK